MCLCLLVYMSTMCVYQMGDRSERVLVPWNYSCRQLSASMWKLGTKPRSPTRVARALNLWFITPTPQLTQPLLSFLFWIRNILVHVKHCFCATFATIFLINNSNNSNNNIIIKCYTYALHILRQMSTQINLEIATVIWKEIQSLFQKLRKLLYDPLFYF